MLNYKIACFTIFIIILSLSLVFLTRLTLSIIAYFIVWLYIMWGAQHLILLIIGIKEPVRYRYNYDIEYPKFSLIIPVRSEPEALVSRTIETCLLHTDYPIEKKEIVIVTEDEGMARTAMYYQQRYPGNVKLLFRRNGFKTKPSAMNDALALTDGDIIGVVDAEDIVERDLLKKVAVALMDYDIVQVMLIISNAADSWISRMFYMEYSGWFRIWLNARSKLRLYIPLGGTGNYIKRSTLLEVGKWDAINLAEDAELAIRLLLAGKKSTVIDARQWEEAPVTVKAWIKQRTRWYRGWLQSLWKYMPILVKPSVIKRVGLVRILSMLAMLIAPLVTAIGYIAYTFTILFILEYYNILATSLTESLFPIYSIIPLVFNIIYYQAWLYGAKLTGMKFSGVKDMLRVVCFAVVYLNILMPIAAWRAIYQSIFKDVFWEKTRHEGRGVRWTVRI